MPTPSATIEIYSITPIQNLQDITFTLNNQAEDGGRRPWYTSALDNIRLREVSCDNLPRSDRVFSSSFTVTTLSFFGALYVTLTS